MNHPDNRRGHGEAASTAKAWISTLELRHLRALVALVDSGSMTAAARQLGVSQSTVSETVAALERALGTPAVARRRGAQGSALTTAGQALLPHARRVLASLDEAQAAVAAAAREARARVQVIANESVSTYLLPRALAQLRPQWPNTRFVVSVGTCPMVREGLARGSFDIGLLLEDERQGTRAAEAATAAPLAAVTLVVFGGVGHPLARAGAAVPRPRLAPYPVFSSDASGHFHALLVDYFHADGLPGPRLESAGSVEAVKRSVADNPLALGVLPSYAVAEELAAGSLAALSLRPPLPRLRLDALLSAGAGALPVRTELVEAVRKLLAPAGTLAPRPVPAPVRD